MGFNREPRKLNIVSVPIYLLLIAAIYGGWKYLPVYWEWEEISNMVSSVLAVAHKTDDSQMQQAILERLDSEFNIELVEEDLVIRRDNSGSWIYVTLYYPVEVEHLFSKYHSFDLRLEVKRRIIDL